MTRPYKACEDNDLFDLLYSLNHPCIHPQYIETDGSLLVKVSCCYNLDIVADCYIKENGIIFNGHKDVMSKLTIGTDTLLQLAAMSTCFAAGYAKARQEHAEKQLQQEQENNQKSIVNSHST